MENQRPAAWRVVFKGLTLLEHLIKNGSERCVDDARNHGHSLRSLHQFNYYEGTIDRGLGVREKSKQLVEILGDDERIREERQKARQLREKFGSSQGGGGVSSAGKYSGYGNDNWNSGGSGGGYGDSGIGSNRYDNNTDSRGYSGRYDDENTPAPSRSVEPTPTFAALPPEQPKKAKMKKNKKKKDEPDTPTADASVDLFSFDTPAPVAAPAAVDDDFDSFQSAGGAISGFGGNDPFAAPASASQPAAQFNAFGASAPAMQQPVASFDAFGGPSQQQQPQQSFGFGGMSDPFSSNNTNAMNGGNMAQLPMGSMANQSAMGQGGMKQQPQNLKKDDHDDFGDFATANSFTSSKPSGPVDPLSKLISLDGLSKNSSKDIKEAKLNEPIIATPAAATFLQEKDQIQAAMKKTTGGNSMSFEGIDGLPKHNTSFGKSGGMLAPPVPIGGGFNPNVMGAGAGGNLDAISALDPSIMMAQKQQQQQQMPGMMNQGFGAVSMQQQGGMGGFGISNSSANSNGMPGGIGVGGMSMGGMQGGMGMSGMHGGMGMVGMQGGMGMSMQPGVQGGMGMGMQPGVQGGMGMGMQPGLQGAMGMGMQGGMGIGMQPGMHGAMGMNMQQGAQGGMGMHGMNMQGGMPGMGMQGGMGGDAMGGFR